MSKKQGKPILHPFIVNKIGLGVVIFLNISVFLCISINNLSLSRDGAISFLIMNIVSIISLIGLKRK